jgi:galactokinase
VTDEAERADHVDRQFADHFGHRAPGLTRAPGRVNIIGEHVDYNEGWVLPAAIERSVLLAFEPASEPEMEIVAVDLGQTIHLPLLEATGGLPSAQSSLPSWVRYPAGVAWALRQSGRSVCGLRAAFASSIPIGAGLSSSAAVEAAFALAWQAVGGWSASAMELALMCQRAENEYVGVHCGLMDQFASLHGQRGQALMLDCRSLAWGPVPIPAEAVVVVADSGVRHQLGASAYNTRRAECDEAVRLLQPRLPGIHTLRDVTPADFAQHAEVLPPAIRCRAQHVIEECERTHKMAAALRQADLARAGDLLNKSHESLRMLYEVSGPELDALASAARRLHGCYGARLTGAGFGGCTVQLVAAVHAVGFSRSLGAEYTRATGRQAEVMITIPAQGAQVLRYPG